MQNNQVVKRLLPEHLSAVAAVERECFSTPWSENALRILTEEPHIGFVLERDGSVLGYGGMQCVFDEGQITCPTNGLNPKWGGYATLYLETPGELL